MAKTGRPPDPRKLLRADNRGWDPVGRRWINTDAPKAEAIAPPCPQHLKGEERKTWKRIIRSLKSMGLLSKVDQDPIAEYCVNYAVWLEAKTNYTTEAKLYKTKNGSPFFSPWYHVMRRAAEDMRKFWSEFGFGPGSRTRIKVEKEKPVDPVAEFAKKKGQLILMGGKKKAQ